MSKRKPAPGGRIPRPVWVEWVDSATGGGWLRFPAEHGTIHCISLGFLIRESRDSITIAASLGFNDRDVADQACDAITIPRVAVRVFQDIEFQ